jgi:DNA polymerase III alpha subunit (gram-positive type)
MDNKKKREALNKIAEFIDYVKVQPKVKSANLVGKEKILYFNKKEVKLE